MTDADSDDSADGTTVLVHDYPVLDGFIIRLASSLFTIGVVALTIRSWQLFVQGSAMLLPGIIGAVVAFGALLSVPFLVDLDSG